MVEKRLLLIAAFFLASCTSDAMLDAPADGTPVEHAVAQKIVNTSASAHQGRLLVYFNDAAVPDIEASTAKATRSNVIATRSGIAGVDEVLAGLEVGSLRRVFPYTPKYEERTRAAGLHKWYLITFDESADLDAAARQLAGLSEVKNIEFDAKLKVQSVGEAHPLKESDVVITRAGAFPFNDPYNSKQWHYINTGDQSVSATVRAGADINVKEAWKLTCGDPRIVVAIVDQGVKYTHPDLAANMWVNAAEKSGGANNKDDDGNGYIDDIYGFNFATGGAISWDKPYIVDGENKGDSGHGTHVAGTVAAVNNNGVGVSGIAGGTGNNDGVKLMSCQVFSGGAAGSGTVTAAAEAIKYAADNGAIIIQCSFGYPGGGLTSDNAYERYSSAERQAIDYFITEAGQNCEAVDGGLVIFAAGNDAVGMSGYPGAYRSYISVTSFGPDYLPAYYTNYGPGSNISAPGGDYKISADAKRENAEVLSTLVSEISGSEYGFMQGTSMSCPHVSGVAALGLSYALKKGKHFTLDEFKSMLLSSVNDMETYLDGSKAGMDLSKYRKQMGTGSVDAYQLLMQVEGTPCLKAKVGVKQIISLAQFFGGSAANLTYTDIEMTQEAKDKLGITTDPAFSYGKLEIKCTKAGVAKIKIKAIAGGSAVGTPTQMGGMEITKEFAIIARGVQTTNGGWL